MSLAAHRCLEHLQSVLPLTEDVAQHLTWHNCTSDNNLLTVDDKEDVLGFNKISGTSDVAVITAASSKTGYERKGLCTLFELKKPESLKNQPNKAKNQAVCQLVLANMLSRKLKPVVVLTDLQDQWFLYWMDGSNVKVAFCSRGAALWTIDGCIKQAATLAAGAPLPCLTGPAESLPDHIAKRGAAVFPEGVDVAGDVGNLADLEGFLPDEELGHARAAVLLQRFFDGACLPQPAAKAPPGMYA